MNDMRLGISAAARVTPAPNQAAMDKQEAGTLHPLAGSRAIHPRNDYGYVFAPPEGEGKETAIAPRFNPWRDRLVVGTILGLAAGGGLDIMGLVWGVSWGGQKFWAIYPSIALTILLSFIGMLVSAALLAPLGKTLPGRLLTGAIVGMLLGIVITTTAPGTGPLTGRVLEGIMVGLVSGPFLAALDFSKPYELKSGTRVLPPGRRTWRRTGR